MRITLGLWWLASCWMAAAAMAQETSPDAAPAGAPSSLTESAPTAGVAPGEVATGGGRAQVLVIPVRQQIAQPVLYVLRRGLKDAIERGVDLVVLDMDTPGGALNVTFDIMEAVGKFDGATATYVNDEAISAGAFIAAVTDEIYFAPLGVIGAAAPVMSTGGEIDESMKQKIVSYLRARVRAISEGHGHRGAVISAMIDADYELKIGDEVLKPKGELLSLTAQEASRLFGDPPAPLLAAGIVPSVEALLIEKFGTGGYDVTYLEVTWSEEVAQVLNTLSPLLLGLGLLGLFIEFKTPGFGLFGIAGGIMLVVVFFGHYLAGLSGHEPALVFGLGVVLVLVELLFFPGILVVALSGALLMLGSLIWSMADIWPNEPLTLNADLLLEPLLNLAMGLLVALVGALLVVRFLPRGWFWDRMILGAAIGSDSGAPTLAPGGAGPDPLIGRRGTAATALFPSGQVVVDGQRFEARLEMGFAEPGTPVVVVARRSFGLIVERVTS